ncbi:hypothetical protein CB0940_09012 [Cercospora beticola]|uniref:Fungal N-terminal domain-containing protein n=1 Tax=Cercospora beticola TaxID=122368 RepID=A0A2G5HIU6_CERBT|nr:hypothetical protein CB0940_09012 [Cercospora beticola]PIA92123.1 hypothetical protein CB0940_09012 [Cercospora beticola]WPB06716.1 hypothetical protein RHO25_011375 [Cercospora beticola]
MNSPLLSRNDVLMLSQTACRIGRAFAHGKDSNPVEFAQVERELNCLGGTLKLVAGALREEDSVLSHADDETRGAINEILQSVRKTLAALERFVDRYQVIQKKDTGHGFVVERTWSRIVLENYKTFKWTIQGCDIQALQEVLLMYTTCLELILQALQSRAPGRLAATVVSIAQHIAPIHEKGGGSESLRKALDNLHQVIVALTSRTESLKPHGTWTRPASIREDEVAYTPSLSDISLSEEKKYDDISSRISNDSQHRLHQRRSLHQTFMHAGSTLNFTSDGNLTAADALQQAITGSQTSGSSTSLKPQHSASESKDLCASPQDSAYEGESSFRTSWRRDSATLPALFRALEEDSRATAGSTRSLSTEEGEPPPLPVKSKRRSMPPPLPIRRSAQRVEPDLLPLSAMENTKDTIYAAAKASSVSTEPRRAHNGADGNSPSSKSATKTAYQQTIHIEASGINERQTFERQLFRNSAILCDVRGRLIEYAQHNPEIADMRYNVEMKPACKECRILVIRRRENREYGGTKVATSVWCLSDDDETRIQQKLSETQETVPYCSYFEPEKVSLAGNTEEGGQVSLKFHAKEWGAMLEAEKSTNWVNYYFAIEVDAVMFQSAVFGRKLLGSFRTTKTTVIHEGLKGAFAFEEQFANIEMLRLWEEDGVETPGAAGGVMALMHISSNFGEGWARWWINNIRQHVRIKEDGSKFVKVKGIDVTVARPGATARQAERAKIASMGGVVNAKAAEKDAILKKVGGIKIEFKTEEERNKFVEAAKEAQTRSLPLPEL